MKSGFVYIWYDCKRKMYYIGSHWGPEDDGYICSSRRMRNAHRRRPNDFKRRILMRLPQCTRKELLEHEQKWLSLVTRKDRYYNISFQVVLTNYSRKGILVSSETRGKMSANMKALWTDPEYRTAATNARRGRKFSDKGRQNMSAKFKGRKYSEEAVAKSANARRGQKRSLEVRRKMSEARKGKKLDKELGKYLLIILNQ